MKITKREILLSIAIIAIMALIGLMIHESISDSLMLKYQQYNTALHIDSDQELFEYGMRTNIGNAFVYGELNALTPVSYPEVDGEYSQMKKVKERYTMHTRTVTYAVDGKVKTRLETYWSWDAVDSWYQYSGKIAFLNVPFDHGTIELPSMSYIDTIKESSHVRYVYYGTPASCTGTLYTFLNNSTIENPVFYYGFDIPQTIEYLEAGSEFAIFWIAWIVLTSALVFGFYRFENNWLEDHPRKSRKRNTFGRGCSKSELRFNSTYLH